jgi:hypothetical protein
MGSRQVGGSYAFTSSFAMTARRGYDHGMIDAQTPCSPASPTPWSAWLRPRRSRRRPSPARACSGTIPSAGAFVAAPDYPMPLDLLVGVERQKDRFVENLTPLRRRPALQPRAAVGRARHGQELDDQGRLHERWPRIPALKLIEVDRDEVAALPPLFDLLRARSERFVVLCDDLSFEDGAAAAKALKSALEGGVAGPPENVLFVATSNRRHLMPRDHVEKPGRHRRRRERRGGDERLRPLRPVDRLPADGPADLSGGDPRLCRAVRPQVENLERRALQWSQLRGARSRAGWRGSSSATWRASWARSLPA